MLGNLSHMKMDFSPVLQVKEWSPLKYDDYNKSSHYTSIQISKMNYIMM